MNNNRFDPKEIRLIREQLGLTQREAGELLGGGPECFRKVRIREKFPFRRNQ